MTISSKITKRVTVYGAYGHTGKFIVSCLLERGFIPVLAGRDPVRLEALGALYPALDRRTAFADNPASLDRAIAGSAAVINCAGPFLDTAIPVVEAALRAGIHYIDIAAEQQTVRDVYQQFDMISAAKKIVILPAMAFYGGLADLLATAAMGDWTVADAIHIGVALSSWLPTEGTRLTGRRNTYRRLVYRDKLLVPVADPLRQRIWHFAPLFGQQEMVEFPLTEIITISKHLNTRTIDTFINTTPLNDLHQEATPAPTAADESGRSDQVFLMEAEVWSGDQVRKAGASGRDIYGITAPLVAEALSRIMTGQVSRYGVVAPGEAFDAADFLRALTPQALTLV